MKGIVNLPAIRPAHRMVVASPRPVARVRNAARPMAPHSGQRIKFYPSSRHSGAADYLDAARAYALSAARKRQAAPIIDLKV